MSTKGTGLAAFAVNASAQPPEAYQQTSADNRGKNAAGARRRGKKDTVALSLRVNRKQWERLHHLALHEGTSINALAIAALSAMFEARGLKL